VHETPPWELCRSSKNGTQGTGQRLMGKKRRAEEKKGEGEGRRRDRSHSQEIQNKKTTEEGGEKEDHCVMDPGTSRARRIRRQPNQSFFLLSCGNVEKEG